MSLKEIRIRRNWSQDELALLSGLSVRTIQRIERNHKAGLESLKSLAAAFNIDVAELQEELKLNEESGETFAKNIIGFYAMSASLIFTLIFPLMSALKDPSNWGPFVVICFCYMLIIGALAWQIFGASWRATIISWHQKN